ncbi:MAG: diguanylate cyclase, partial [Phycisphaerales bacterium]|nr:diguanylate cyclase [Phycisphaerales bacterium]
QAVALLGIRTVKMMALSFSMLAHRSKIACAGFDQQRFYLCSFACAVAAKQLSSATKIGVPQEAYVAGLLSQIGLSALASAIPDEYGKILAAAANSPRGLPKLERAALGTTYAEFGAHLLRSWGMPESLCGAVESFRSVDETPQTPPLAPILYAAEIVAEIVCGVGEREPSQVPRFVQAARQFFALDDQKCAAVISETARELKESRKLFDLPAAGMRGVDDIEIEVRERITELGMAMYLENQTLVHRQEELLHRATTDSLTGVGNRAAFDARLALELQRAARDGSEVGLLMIDADYFKRFNDTYGHQAGDRVLQVVARLFDENVRGMDYVARYGGEEFVVIAPTTSKQGIAQLAERLRAAVEAIALKWEGENLHMTISIGAAIASGFHDVQAAAVSLIRAADANLYAAKSAGRNRVSWGPTEKPELNACSGAA